VNAVRPGSIVAGRFEIERLAKEGGMGAVYRARDRGAGGRVVALKLLRHQGPEEALRFVREAELLAHIPHPGVVEYVAHGADEEGFLFLAMEWLEGEDLDQFLGRTSIGIAEAIGIARAVAEVLAVAHAKGIVHRDLKPGNVFLVERDVRRVKVLDFGIARLLGATLGTGTGMILGTPAYMPPEQARAQRDIDPRADVYALGCVLFECLTGRPPFTGDRPLAVLARMLLEEAPRVSSLRPEVPGTLDDLVLRMLAKKREDRPADGAAVLAELDALGRSSAEVPRPYTPRQSTLGTDEQRLVSLVLVGARPQAATDRTLLPGERDETDESMDGIGASFGVRIESLADGSAVVAFAGVGVATDQAARAVRCAMSLAEAAVEERPIAVATGLGDTSGAIPIGEVIDRAMGLLVVPTRGVRMDEVTAGLVEDRFELSPVGSAFVLVAEREAPVTGGRLLGRPTPCVGRDRELRTLEALYQECVEEPVARAAIVTAPPGAGKSRLCGELLARLAGRTPAPRIWVARGDPMSAGASFCMLAQTLRQALDVRPEQPLDARRERVRAAVARAVPEPERRRVASFLGELVDAPFLERESPELAAARADSMLMGDQMRRAFEDFIAAEAGHAPIVLVLEDLHWGDLPSAGFVDAVLRNARDRPILALGFARPEVDELMLDLWAERGVQRLALGPLARRAAERLVRAVLPDLADERVAALVARADGNAFFLEELVRAEALGQGQDIPRTVLAILQARMDALPVEARRVLRAASVFGQAFWPTGVERLVGARRRPAFPQTADRRAEEAFPQTAMRRAPIPETMERWGDDTGDRRAVLPPPTPEVGADDGHDTIETDAPPDRERTRVEQLLEDLARAELVEPRSDSRLPGEPEWAFRHALVQEAAYATLTGGDRTLGHRLAGEWLESAGEREALVLAEHHERGGDRERAIGWFRTAAEEALEGNDFAGAIARAERGVACGAEGAAKGELRVLQAEASYWKGGLRQCLERATEAAELVVRAGTSWFAAQRLVATASGALGERASLEAVVRKLAVAHTEPGAVDAAVRAWAVASAYLLHAGLLDHARVLCRRAAEASSRSPVADAAMARLAFARGLLAKHEGDAEGYLEGCSSAGRLAETAGDVRYSAGQRANAGFALLELGDDEQASSTLGNAAPDLARFGLEQQLVSLRINQALVALRHDQAELAIRIVGEALAHAGEKANQRQLGIALDMRAEALLASGRAEEAIEEAERAIHLLGGAVAWRPHARAVVAAAMLSLGRLEDALQAARAATSELHASTSSAYREGFVHLVHARAASSARLDEEARAVVARGVESLTAAVGRIRSPRLRRTLAHGIPEHRALIALAQELGVPGLASSGTQGTDPELEKA